MHHYIDPVEPSFEEISIGLELERVRHDTRCIRVHPILGDDGITVDATSTKQGSYHNRPAARGALKNQRRDVESGTLEFD